MIFSTHNGHVFWRSASLTDDQIGDLLAIFSREGRLHDDWELFDRLSAAMGEATLQKMGTQS